MNRRSAVHDYARPGVYHITLHVADDLGRPFGQVVGNLYSLDGSADAPHVTLSSVGRMVEQELLNSISAHYPMITVDTYVIMPEHLHVILRVSSCIVSTNGRSTHLGQVIAGFKQGCNSRYWEMTHQAKPDATVPASAATAPTAAVPTVSAGSASRVPSAPAAPTVSAGSATAPAALTVSAGSLAAPTVSAGSASRVPSAPAAPGKKPRFTTGRPPLFAEGYVDVMPLDEAQLATQRQYIHDNPRSRLLRSSDRAKLHTQRHAITTALTVTALRGYLRRECGPTQASPEALAQTERHLLLADGLIACDTYGSQDLLTAHRLLPVVCHRKDKSRFTEQKARCLEEAANGAVLVSPRIAEGEQEIIDETVNRGYHVILIADNGFPERYHPSADRIDRCSAGQLLLVTPWTYEYRGKNETINVTCCKTMNCVAQALCRLKDNWWQQ